MKVFVFFEFNTKGTVALEKRKSGKSFAINPLRNNDSVSITHQTYYCVDRSQYIVLNIRYGILKRVSNNLHV